MNAYFRNKYIDLNDLNDQITNFLYRYLETIFISNLMKIKQIQINYLFTEPFDNLSFLPNDAPDLLQQLKYKTPLEAM